MRIPTCDELQRFNSEVQRIKPEHWPGLLRTIPADTVAYWIDHLYWPNPGHEPEQAAREMLAPHGTEQRA